MSPRSVTIALTLPFPGLYRTLRWGERTEPFPVGEGTAFPCILLTVIGVCDFLVFCGIVFVFADDTEKNKAEILLLSIAANVVSRHTSMVGVDEDRKKKIVGPMIQRDVPLMTSPTFAYAAPPMASLLSGGGPSRMDVSNCAQRSEELFSKILVISRVKISGDWIPWETRDPPGDAL